jgi:hypothetical protein
MTASFILSKQAQEKWAKALYILQLSVAALLLLLLGVINAWAFPAKNILIICGVVILLAVVFYFIKSGQYDRLQKSVAVSVATMVFTFFLLNTNFYPQLLTYQGGNELAFITKGKVNAGDVYFWKETYSSSFNFYSSTIRKMFDDSVMAAGKKIWLLYDIRNEDEIKQAGYLLGERFTTLDYEITKLDIKFVNPAKRESQCTKMIIAEVSR